MRNVAPTDIHHIGIAGAGIAGLAAGIAIEQGLGEHHIHPYLFDPNPKNAGAMKGEHRVLVWSNGWDALASLTSPKTGERTDGTDKPDNINTKAIQPFGTVVGRFEHRQANGDLIWGMDTSTLPGGSTRTRFVQLSKLRSHLKTHLNLTPTEVPTKPEPAQTWPPLILPHKSAALVKGTFDRFFDNGAIVRTWIEVSKGDTHELNALGLIGADGKNSKVRQQLLTGKSLRDLGQTLFAGMTSIANIEDAQRYWPDPKENNGETRVVGFLGEGIWFDGVRDEDKVYWFAAIKGSYPNSAREKADTDLNNQVLVFPKCIQEIIRHSKPTSHPGKTTGTVDMFPMNDVKPARRIHGGGVALLGDSAHGVTLILGQSVGLALEDAATLRYTLEKAMSQTHGTNGGRATRDRAHILIRQALADYSHRRSIRPAVMNHISHNLPKLAMSQFLPESWRNALDRATMPLSTQLAGRALLRFDPRNLF